MNATLPETTIDSTPKPGVQRLVIVTGPSGAGRSTAINVLEDLGFEVIDNLPLSILPRLLDGPPLVRPMALGLDTRNRDFTPAALIDIIAQLGSNAALRPELLYVDCQPEILIRRFSETRRRHPLAPAESPAEGIAREADLLVPVRARADILIDTTDLTPHDLRAEIARWFDAGPGQGLAVSVQSFSYKRGIPSGVDMVFDCRFLRNPYWIADLRPLTGQDAAVAAHVAGDPRFGGFFARLLDLCDFLLPAYADEGKAHLAIALGCTGGQHRSVALAEQLGKALMDKAWRVSIRHRELERRGMSILQAKSGLIA
ncbi:MAG: RNase adapter RapZ [Paracoccaceae bacterium]